MKNNSISIEQAKTLVLASQGLLKNNFGKGKAEILAIIEHLGYVQIDTLSVVARAHHHTLWTRLPSYDEKHLNELLEKDKTIFEYWSHAASYLPMSEYRFSLPRKISYSKGKSHWFTQDKKMQKYVLDKIKAEGALQSKDFEFNRTGAANWYEWKPAKRALEQLFMEGKLMVAKRKGFQKVYDLAERVLPKSLNTTIPTEKEYVNYLIIKAVQANGIVTESEITYLRSGLKDAVNKALKQLLKEGELMEVMIEKNTKSKFITSAKQLDEIEKIQPDNLVHIFSPFDNAVIQRKRIQTIFDFDYAIECYLPENKRKYGYFILPVLFNNNFIARFDPKADRAEKTFYIKSFYFESSFKPNEEFNKLFSQKLKSFTEFNNCSKIKLENVDRKWKKEMKNLL